MDFTRVPNFLINYTIDGVVASNRTNASGEITFTASEGSTITVTGDGEGIWNFISADSYTVTAEFDRTDIFIVEPAAVSGIPMTIHAEDNTTGNPVTGIDVKMDPISGSTQSGVTDSSGNFTGTFPEGEQIIIDIDAGANWRILPDIIQTITYLVNIVNPRTDTVLLVPTPPPEVPPFNVVTGDFQIVDFVKWTVSQGWITDPNTVGNVILGENVIYQAQANNISGFNRNMYYKFWLVQRGTGKFYVDQLSDNGVPAGGNIIRDITRNIGDFADIGTWDFIAEVYRKEDDSLQARDFLLNIFDVSDVEKLSLPLYLSSSLLKLKLTPPIQNQLIIKAGNDTTTEPIDEFGISLLEFLKKKHNITLDNTYDKYILSIDGIYQASDPKKGFWTIFIDNNLAIWEEGGIPYITCLEDKTLPGCEALGAEEIILKEGMNIRIEYIML